MIDPILSRYELRQAEEALLDAADRVRVARTMWAARQDAESAAELAEALEALHKLRARL